MKKMNKHFSALAIAALLLVGSISVGAASAYKEVTARQNTGMQVKSGDIELTLKDDNGNTLYPLTYNNVISVGAASAYKEVTARQNTGMQVKSGDIELTLKDDNGNTLYPLTYNNVIYLPAEQLADLMGYDTTVTTNSIRLEPKASTDDIGAGKAKAIALNHAGISASQVVFVKVDKEYDDGRLHYDVEFYSGNKEYDYEIAAKDGSILSVDMDIENYTIPSVGTSDSAKNYYDVEFYSGNKEYDYEIAAKDGSILSVDMDIENYTIPSVGTSDSAKNYIGIKKAKQTALSKAGLSSSSVHWEKAELDYDDGRAEYELEFHSGHREYECTVDAVSGKVLSFERD